MPSHPLRLAQEFRKRLHKQWILNEETQTPVLLHQSPSADEACLARDFTLDGEIKGRRTCTSNFAWCLTENKFRQAVTLPILAFSFFLNSYMQIGYNLKFLVCTNTFPSTKRFGQHIVKGNTLQLMSRCRGTDLPLMHWWKENYINPLQTQRAFISMIDWTQDTLMTFPRQERLRIKTFPFHTPSPKNNLRTSKALDFSWTDICDQYKDSPKTNVFIYVRLPVLIHEEVGVKVWNFTLSLNRHIISSPFPFSLHVSPLTQLISCSTLLQQHCNTCSL